jgi:hypothetical protein
VLLWGPWPTPVCFLRSAFASEASPNNSNPARAGEAVTRTFPPHKSWRFGVFVTHDRSIDKRPVNADIGIIPQNGALAGLVVESAGFVEE